ncbi:hypothetical protein [Sorangium sp. So ce1099]|uniref:hypothetical protein n=1 Tax=Sorangium sp. So ce1099 TaxID=3133331 RepID=UPI003F640084
MFQLALPAPTRRPPYWKSTVLRRNSIGIGYLDEDQLTVEGVTFALGPPVKGGISWDQEGNMVTGEDGVAVETLRFSE